MAVGAILGAWLQRRTAYELDQRRFAREAKAAARIVHGELTVTVETLEDVKRLGHWLPVHDVELGGWDRHAPTLANAMSAADVEVMVALFARLGRVRRVVSYGATLVRSGAIELEKVPELDTKLDELRDESDQVLQLLRPIAFERSPG